MDISIFIKDLGEQRLFIQPFKGADNEFALIRGIEDIDNPYLHLKLDSNNVFKIISQREIDETEDSLNDKLSQLAIDVLEAIQQGVDLSAVS
jgi:hypothetical protein